MIRKSTTDICGGKRGNAMGRLIDADELLKHKYHDSNRYENAVACYYICNAPTIDAVEVVRCKDCRHCHYEQEDDIYHCDKLFHRFYDTEHYCSYGERETDHE